MKTTPDDSPLPGDAGALPETVISSRADVRLLQAIRDLWAYRDLFAAFVRRDLTVRYRQTALGVIWVVLQPLATGGVFAVIFRRLGAGADQSALESLLFYMAGLVPWMAFASAVQKAATSLETNASLVTKVYFPRMAVPGAYVAAGAVDFLIAFSVLAGLAAWTGRFSIWLLVAMPLLLLLQTAAALGLGFFFAILNAQYRDVKYVVPFVLTIGLFLTVILPLAQWGDLGRAILSWNPMMAVVEAYRAVLAGKAVDAMLMAKGTLSALVALAGGVWFFRHREHRLVDIL
ncbi:MAG: lipopolysaccharide transport system permease protein [Candidatus Sumerlaeota bacterium]|nr:lipopolysaccharide transport system permease protein [Candidatus Sumerlaeota bacterium]